jgi:Tfp pilus assembly protein PilX
MGKNNGNQVLLYSGQALLIVLLSMAVILVIVLSILSRSITDVTITSHEEEALRAFSAAEAGVEQALIALGPASGSFEGASFNAQVSQVSEGNKDFVSPLEVPAGDSATVWFVSHADDGSLTCTGTVPCFTGPTMRVCWGRAGTGGGSATTPAMEVSVLYANTPGSYSTIRVGRATFDPNASRRTSNAFTAANSGCNIGGTSFAFYNDISFSALGIPANVYNTRNGLQLTRLRLLYNTDGPQSVGLDVNFPGDGILPSQGKRIESTGVAGDSTRKVEVYNLFADLPGIFDSVLFTPGSITK